jgi:hypothetical protein
MTKDEALRLAMEALEVANSLVDGYYLEKGKAWLPEIEEAITAIKAALEAKDEPVAWRTFDGEGGYDYRTYDMNENYANEWNKRNPKHNGWVEPLYTTPSQRTWVGLTDKEIWEWFRDNTALTNESGIRIVRAIEVKLRSKNNE